MTRCAAPFVYTTRASSMPCRRSIKRSTPDGKGARVEPKQHHPDHQQGQKTIQGMNVQFALRPVIRRPPQPGAPAFADAEHLLHPGLVPIGFHDASRFKLLAVGKEDGLATVAMFDLPLLTPLPLPGAIHHRPLTQREGGYKEVFESVVAYQLGDLAPDGFLGSGTVFLCRPPEGGVELQQLLLSPPLQQVQRAYLLAIKIGAEADQEFTF